MPGNNTFVSLRHEELSAAGFNLKATDYQGVEHTLHHKIILLNQNTSKNPLITEDVIRAYIQLFNAKMQAPQYDYPGMKRHCDNLRLNVFKDFIKLADDLLENKPINQANLDKLNKKHQNNFHVNVALRTAITAVITAIIVAGIAAGAAFCAGAFLICPPIGTCIAATAFPAGVMGLTAAVFGFFHGKNKQKLYKNEQENGDLFKNGKVVINTIKPQSN